MGKKSLGAGGDFVWFCIKDPTDYFKRKVKK
jgi:hypothetical protein